MGAIPPACVYAVYATLQVQVGANLRVDKHGEKLASRFSYALIANTIFQSEVVVDIIPRSGSSISILGANRGAAHSDGLSTSLTKLEMRSKAIEMLFASRTQVGP